jgi:hypothetical protein
MIKPEPKGPVKEFAQTQECARFLLLLCKKRTKMECPTQSGHQGTKKVNKLSRFFILLLHSWCKLL